ncbi:MAG: hypothetical protein WKG06_42110 [Segetibacter sp.]
MIFLFGVLCLSITFSLWKYGTTPSAKALIIPLLVVSIVSIGIGLSRFSIQKDIVSYEKAYNENPVKFVVAEKERTESFIRLYPYTRYACAGVISIALIVFLSTLSPFWKSISLCIILSAFALLVIDYFSEERAAIYHREIVTHMNNKLQ